MPNQEVLNEFSAKAIVAGFNTLLQAINKSSNGDFAELKRSSISRASRDLVMSFPVICSDSVEPQTASLITKALEKKDVSMLTLLFTSYHLKGNSGLEIMKKFHKNMNTNMIDVGEYMDYMDSLQKDIFSIGSGAVGDYIKARFEAYNYKDELITSRELDSTMVKSFLESLNNVYPENDFSESALTDFYTISDYKGYDVLKSKPTTLNEVGQNTGNSGRDNSIRNQRAGISNEELNRMKYNLDVDKYNQSKDIDDRNYRYQRERDKVSDEFKKQQLANSDRQFAQNDEKLRFEKEKNREDFNYRAQKDNISGMHNIIVKQLDVNNAAKINELVPSYIIIRFYANDETNPHSVQEFIAGVKANLYPVPSEEIIEQIVNLNRNNINNSFLRATTGEAKFAADFMMATKQAKIDALKNSKENGNPIWRALQSRAASSNARNAAFMRKSPAAAISTVIITDQEVDYLKTNYNIDISNPRKAIEFMRNYNLMCFVIINEQTETARFLYDGDNNFINYSFSSLDKENRTKDSDRKIVNLVSSAYR